MSNLTDPSDPKKASSTAYPLPSGQPRKRTKTRLVLAVLVLAGLLGMVYVGYLSHKNAAPGMMGAAGAGSRRGAGGGFPGMNGPLPVVVRTARKGDIKVVLDGLGTVTPLATVTVRPQVSGQLTQVNYTEGQIVNKGDLLAVIDPRPFEATLNQAQGQLKQAEAQLKEAQIDLDRYVTLSAQDSISKQQVDAQKALVSQYEGLVQTDRGAADNAQLSLNYAHIVAPFTGRVGLRLVDAGNYVTPGDSTGLVILTQMKPITVIFPLAEDYIPALQKRMKLGTPIPVDAYDRSGTTKLASGTLASIDNTVDPTTGMFKLRATFPNDDEALYPSQFVVTRMLLNVDQGVTVIPTSAIERGQQGTFVYVLSDAAKKDPAGTAPAAEAKPAWASQMPKDPDARTVTAKPVVLGNTEGERVEVLSGLSVGDQVVVDGADRLKDGMEVKPQDPNASTGAPGAPDSKKHWKQGGSN